jgi:hypothetical protein
MKTILIGRKHGKEDWQLIAGPNTTTSDQLIVRDEIAKTIPVNDTWAEVWLLSAEEHVKGRLKFLTATQFKDNAAAAAKADADLANSRAEAEARENKQREEAAEKSRRTHEAEVAGLNKQHDAHRAAISPMSKAAERIIAAGRAASE